MVAKPAGADHAHPCKRLRLTAPVFIVRVGHAAGGGQVDDSVVWIDSREAVEERLVGHGECGCADSGPNREGDDTHDSKRGLRAHWRNA